MLKITLRKLSKCHQTRVEALEALIRQKWGGKAVMAKNAVVGEFEASERKMAKIFLVYPKNSFVP